MLVRPEFSILFKRINYTFNNINILNAALTHRSFDVSNNERLEFLGDSILSFIIAEELYQRFPSSSEGELSRLRSFLVKGETLSEIAKEIDLGEFLLLGQGELKSGGNKRPSILADAVEALIAAVYQDADFSVCKRVVLNLFESRLNTDLLKENIKDPKTLLQEYLQAEKYDLPQYLLVSCQGEQHEQEFLVQCQVEGIEFLAQGLGRSRRRAEQQAAKKMLLHMRSNRL